LGTAPVRASPPRVSLENVWGAPSARPTLTDKVRATVTSVAVTPLEPPLPTVIWTPVAPRKFVLLRATPFGPPAPNETDGGPVTGPGPAPGDTITEFDPGPLVTTRLPRVTCSLVVRFSVFVPSPRLMAAAPVKTKSLFGSMSRESSPPARLAARDVAAPGR